MYNIQRKEGENMENFKNNSTAIDFLKKNKVRLQSLAAAVIVAGSLVGCSKEETPVETSPAELYINNSIPNSPPSAIPNLEWIL